MHQCNVLCVFYLIVVRWGQGGEAAAVSSSLFASSLEQYLDVTRMRSKEVLSALQRANDLAQRMWNSRVIRANPALSALVNLRVIAGLCRWFLEAASKRLMPDFPSASIGTQLILQSMQLHSKVDAELRDSAIANLQAAKFENDSARRM